jgi:hypothetical protein
MRKMNTNKFLSATSLALTVVAFGCSTNRYPGNGEPTMTTPGYGAANQAVTPGSSSGTEVNPPMASSFVGVPQPNTDAVAEAAAQQAYRGRVLGIVNPGGVQAAPRTAAAQFTPPALLVNPQSTINPSVSSPGVEAIAGGAATTAADEALFQSAVGSTGAVVTTPVASASASTAATAPLAMAGAVGVGATPAGGTVMPSAALTAPTTARATTASSTARTVMIQQNPNGQVVVSNMSSVPSTKASTATPSGKK